MENQTFPFAGFSRRNTNPATPAPQREDLGGLKKDGFVVFLCFALLNSFFAKQTKNSKTAVLKSK